ncbi:unnamed protein product [Somion occarium]|uniref:Uncharacterized protein n=1 Tax=Somion occarium TaxID=3059160 RepID=A0ABP1DSP2_9APHY
MLETLTLYSFHLCQPIRSPHPRLTEGFSDHAGSTDAERSPRRYRILYNLHSALRDTNTHSDTIITQANNFQVRYKDDAPAALDEFLIDSITHRHIRSHSATSTKSFCTTYSCRQNRHSCNATHRTLKLSAIEAKNLPLTEDSNDGIFVQVHALGTTGGFQTSSVSCVPNAVWYDDIVLSDISSDTIVSFDVFKKVASEDTDSQYSFVWGGCFALYKLLRGKLDVSAEVQCSEEEPCICVGFPEYNKSIQLRFDVSENIVLR